MKSKHLHSLLILAALALFCLLPHEGTWGANQHVIQASTLPREGRSEPAPTPTPKKYRYECWNNSHPNKPKEGACYSDEERAKAEMKNHVIWNPTHKDDVRVVQCN